MINPFFELQDIVESKRNSIGCNFSKNRADYLTNRYRKRTEKFCKRNKGFFKCKQCKGTGFLKYPYMSIDNKINSVVFHGCRNCGISGVETWIDKMTRGWKASV
jgi:hypothetical protein